MRVLIVLLALTGVACSTDAKGDVRRYQLTGEFVGHEASPARIVVAHDAVQELMPAMTMAFEIGGATPFVQRGDRIQATLHLSGSRSWLENVAVTARLGASHVQAPPATRAVPGVLVPGLPLIDQDGEPMTLRDPAGRVMVVSFIYSRCPMPDLCPLVVSHLETLRRRVNEEGQGRRLALLGVTLDPAFDTPAVLRAYGESMLKGTTRFDQWTLATGTAAQVEDAARFFDVGYRADRGFVVHTLTTAVIGGDGRVVRLFASNSWRPDELFDVVRREIARVAAQ